MLLHAWLLPHGMCTVPAAQVLQEALGIGMLLEGNLLLPARSGMPHEDLLLQGLPHGA
jgi:hypothetical protein